MVSNREPYIHNLDENGEMKVQRPASGLVSALEPVTRACGGTWIAHGSGSGDPRGGGQPRPGDGAALEPLLRPAPDLALGRGAGRLLLRLRQ